MILLFKIIIITSIWVLGLTIATSDGMILEKWKVWGKAKMDEGHVIVEPLIMCEWCMPSLHSIFGYAFAFGIGVLNNFSWRLVVMYPLVVMGSSFVCGVSWTIYNMVKNKRDYYSNAESVMYFEKKDRIAKHKKQNGRPTGNRTSGV